MPRAAKAEDCDFDIAAPEPAALVESLRAFGYELQTALADLVDNSITAKARNVWIDFHWDGARSIIAVTDDGEGMSADRLIEAMRPGSQNPRQARASHDLGRFGLGLKTASFSQARRVTVRTLRCGGEIATRCWDLDHIAEVNKWQLLRGGDAEAEGHFRRLEELPHGTAIVWQAIDRLVAGQSTENERQQQYFLQRAQGVRQHLAMVFHQFIEQRKSLALHINDRVVEPWNPFLPNEVATQVLPKTTIIFKGVPIEVEPFVLPHHSKMPKGVHEAAAGPRGWNTHQGFYIYRNQRLLVPGDWLNFGWAKEEHYKLTRIRVEIPNSLDHEWDIDVTKSKATPPPGLRDELRRIAERTRSLAKRVYSFRGAKLARQADAERVLLWEPVAKHDRTSYRLNRSHPLLKQALATATDRNALNALLRLVEETIPFPHITVTNTERPDSLAGPFEHAAESQVREIMKEAFTSLVVSGYGKREAIARLRTIWPFELFPALLETLNPSDTHA